MHNGGYRAPLYYRISGRTTREPCQVLDGILWILHTGALWRDLPKRFGPWNSVYNTFRRWQNTGRMMPSLKHCNCILMKKGLSTSTCGALTAPMPGHPKMLLERVKNTPVNQTQGRSRGGFGCKIHLVTDGNGLPLGFCLSPGQSAEIRYATSALAMARIPASSGPYRMRPAHLAADKAYGSRALRVNSGAEG
ncbi:IS5 family transposase [Aeromonas enteropelogenes]|uniref:IS5 family transposase n=1 Tax=Aeromonas enteropelogenes TaxID=29489 RepID=UPI003B9F43A9